jgi:hypothetical protein
MAVDDEVKKTIDEWRESGTKFTDWADDNIEALNDIYCNKRTLVSDNHTEIALPIKRLYIHEGMFLYVEGEKWRHRINCIEFLFGKDYSLTVKAFSGEQEKLTIRLLDYEPKAAQPSNGRIQQNV